MISLILLGPCFKFVFSVVEQRVRRAAPLQGRQFRSQMYFYYTNRGAHIYLARDSDTPPPPPHPLLRLFCVYVPDVERVLGVCALLLTS